MKKVFNWILKAVFAGIISLTIISCICFFYYNVPIHYETESGATDYSWGKNEIAFRGTEGFAYTKTDKNGYINTFPISNDTIDILVMGSSHTEGFNVNCNENLTYMLNKQLNDCEIDLYAYSIGVSGHTIERCFQNMENAIREFHPTEYVVIETYSIAPSLESLKQVVDGSLEPLPSYNEGVVQQLQKINFFRLVYAQLSNVISQNQDKNDVEENEGEMSLYNLPEYKVYLEKMIEKGSKYVQQNNCELLIVYSPQLTVDYNGNVLPQDISYVKLYEELCKKYNITFLNMQNPFEEMYYKTKKLPHGFSNTAVGKGHMNKYAHECIANEIFNYIKGRNH